MIIEHANRCFRNANVYEGYTRALVVVCDKCGSVASHVGEDAGEAAEAARKEGFNTYKTTPHSSLKWQCKTCSRTSENSP